MIFFSLSILSPEDWPLFVLLLVCARVYMDTTTAKRGRAPARPFSSQHPPLKKTRDDRTGKWTDLDPDSPGGDVSMWSRLHWYIYKNGVDRSSLTVAQKSAEASGALAVRTLWTSEVAEGKTDGASAFSIITYWAAFENFILEHDANSELAKIIIGWGKMQGPYAIPEEAIFGDKVMMYVLFNAGDEGQELPGKPGVTCLGNKYPTLKAFRRTVMKVCTQTGTPNPFRADPLLMNKMSSFGRGYSGENSGRYDPVSYLPASFAAIDRIPRWSFSKKQMVKSMRVLALYLGFRGGSSYAEYCPNAEDILIPRDEIAADGLPFYILLGLRQWKGRPRNKTGDKDICWMKIMRNPNPEYVDYCVMTNLLLWLMVKDPCHFFFDEPWHFKLFFSSGVWNHAGANLPPIA